MNAEFFVLAFTAAQDPKLLAADLLLIENRRMRAMFMCVLLGGLTVALTIGLLDVLALHADAINSQKTVSAGVDLALGLLLLAIGALLATGHLHGRRKALVPARRPAHHGIEQRPKSAPGRARLSVRRRVSLPASARSPRSSQAHASAQAVARGTRGA